MVDMPIGKRTVRELVVAYPLTKAVFSSHGIDYCFGGLRELEAAAVETAADADALMDAVEDAVGRSVPMPDGLVNWASEPISSLMDYIVAHHHAKTRRLISCLEDSLARAMSSHGLAGGNSLPALRRAIETFAVDTERHLFEEETVLFPYLRELEAYSLGASARPHIYCGTARYPIQQRWKEHEDAGENLASMRHLTSEYSAPANASEALRELYGTLREIESDLREHIHLENNILFPRAIEIEKACGIESSGEGDGTEAPPERERSAGA